MAPIVSRQAAAPWPLSCPGRQQRYGPYPLKAGNSVSRSYSESEIVQEYGQGTARSEAARRQFGTEA